jgi:hypothetical protein
MDGTGYNVHLVANATVLEVSYASDLKDIPVPLRSLLLRVTLSCAQVKRAVAKEHGTPIFTQHLWSEGAELQNDSTMAESGVRTGSKISLVKGEAGTHELKHQNLMELLRYGAS